MIHNPKLNIYIIELNKKRKNTKCSFFDYYNTLSDVEFVQGQNSEVFQFFMESFTKFVGGKESFSEDNTVKKVFGIDQIGQDLNLKIDINKFILSGILEGGKYGINRESANIKNKEKRKNIPVTDAILDKFYFLLHTPLNSKTGYLIIQSYTEETILSLVLNKLKEYFYLKSDIYFKPKVELFVPEKFIEKYKRDSSIKNVKYTSKITIDDSYNSIATLELSEFDLEIKLKPKNEIKPESRFLTEIKKVLGKLSFNNTNLEDFDDGRVFIQDDGNRKANFDINKDIDKIKPTIYLSDTDVELNANGVPDFESLHTFCVSLLEEVDEEYKRNLRS